MIRRALFGLLLASSAQAQEATLRVAVQADLRALDPVWTFATITQMHGQMVYDQLFSLDAQLRPHPQMVEAFTTSEDGLIWDFALRPGLRFHDGSAVTTRDVIASLRRWSARAVDGQALAARTEAMEAVDDRSFRIRLRQPFAFLPMSLANAASLTAVIMPERDAQTDPFTAVRGTIGSGPFIFLADQWVPGARAAYRRNPDYLPRAEPADGFAGGKVARLGRVEWTYIPDGQTAANALRTGEIDVLDLVPYDLAPVLRRTRGVELRTLDRVGFQAFIRPNALHPPFNDPRGRQALMRLIDPAAYLPAIVPDPDHAVECLSAFICAPGMPAPRAPMVDVERARALLREAGYAGEPITILAASDLPQLNALGQVLAQDLRRAGAQVDLQSMDWSSVVVRRNNRGNPAADRGGWHIFVSFRPGLTAQNPIINGNLATPCDGRNAWGWPCDDAFEALRRSYVDARTPEEQARIMAALQERFFEVMPYIPVGQFTRAIGHRENVQGFLEGPMLVFWNVVKR